MSTARDVAAQLLGSHGPGLEAGTVQMALAHRRLRAAVAGVLRRLERGGVTVSELSAALEAVRAAIVGFDVAADEMADARAHVGDAVDLLERLIAATDAGSQLLHAGVAAPVQGLPGIPTPRASGRVLAPGSVR